MKTPFMLIGAALLFWGWQTGQLLLGALAAVLLEGARLAHWRWELSEGDYLRLGDVCSGLLILLALYLFVVEEISNSVFAFLRWLPLVYFPMMAAQQCGPRDHVPYDSFLWLLRKRFSIQPPGAGLNLSYPYFALCLLGASGSNRPGVGFYAGVCALVAYALWAVRPRQRHLAVWSFLVLVAAVTGYEGQRRLHEWQPFVEGRLASLLLNWGRGGQDVSQSRTAIGRIGRQKLSRRIVLRVESESPTSPVPLLRSATFDRFRGRTWYASAREFRPILPDPNNNWPLVPNKPTRSALSVAAYLSGGRGVLPLPFGTARIENMPSQEMEANSLGVVRVFEGPGFYDLRADYGPGSSVDGAPRLDDWSNIPVEEKPALDQISSQLRLRGRSFEDTLHTLEQFFREHFQYATYLSSELGGGSGTGTPLSRFLLKRRAGHCEYFATATVLLLRVAGIPARYAVGYSVQERVGGSRFVVRERDAHAWCLAYNDEKKTWEDFDTTPPSWFTVEAQESSWYESLADGWSWLWFEFSRWRYGKSAYRQYVIWLVAPLVVVLVWRVVAGRGDRRRRIQPRPICHARPTTGGEDSEFYLIEQVLSALGSPRGPGEAVYHWIERLPLSPNLRQPLLAIVDLHYRYRFDPRGLTTEERRSLCGQAQAWMSAAHAGEHK